MVASSHSFWKIYGIKEIQVSLKTGKQVLLIGLAVTIWFWYFLLWDIIETIYKKVYQGYLIFIYPIFPKL